ncbi:MAG TPA: hypothetical protein P5327_12230 [Kiritimatiellia bacterium]|nr:hypothetical protein [Kiritimatiellia bacterium]
MKKWTLSKDYLGVDSRDFCFVNPAAALPGLADKIAAITGRPAATPVDIISPKGDGVINVQPNAEMPNIGEAGDIVVYLEPDAGDMREAKRQRCWHNDILATRHGDLFLMVTAATRKTIEPVLCVENKLLRTDKRGQFHLFRPHAPTFPLNDIYQQQVDGWTQIYTLANLVNDDTDMESDPADFTDVEALRRLAISLFHVNSEADTQSLLMVSCAQWVWSIMLLAFCIPLNNHTMTELGVEDIWNNRFRDIPRCDEKFQISSVLPMQPFSKDEAVVALAANYAGMHSLLWDQSLVSKILMLVKLDPQIASTHNALPDRIIWPTFPLWEHRHKRPSTLMEFEYIATVFPDEVCVGA